MAKTDREGNVVNIYDYVTADAIEDGDQIFYEGDPVEGVSVLDGGASIMVKGYSHLTGDAVTYILTPDTEVGLWAV